MGAGDAVVIKQASELDLIWKTLGGAEVIAFDVETSPRQAAKKTITEKRQVEVDGKPVTESVEVEVWDEDANKAAGLDPWRNRLRMVQLSDGERVVVVLCDALEDTSIDQGRYHALKPHLQALFDSALVVGVNLTYDAKQIQHHAAGVRIPHKYDLSIVERLLTAGKYQTDSEWFQGAALKGILHKYCGVEVDKEIREEFGHNTEITQEQIDYGAKDVLYLPAAFAAQWAVVEEEAAQEAVDIEMGAIQGVVEMELHGMPVDQDKWREIADTAAAKRREVYDELQILLAPPKYKALVGDAVRGLKTYNPGSPEETVIAFRRLGVELAVRGDDGKPKASADEQALKAAIAAAKDDQIKYILRRQLDHAEYRKQETTYGYDWLKHINPVTGRVHSNYDQYGAKTGRYTSSRPNMQNLPVRDHPEYRDAFTYGPDSPWRFVISDFAGAELRWLAYLSQDPTMMSAYNADPPKDLHIFAASLIYGVDYDEFVRLYEGGDKVAKSRRNTAKAINFGTAYGIGYKKVAEDTGISEKEAKETLDAWRRAFPVASRFLNEMAQRAWQDGVIYGLAGHRKYFLRPEPGPRYSTQKAGIEREARNWPEQHGNAIMTKVASKLLVERLDRYNGLAWLCHMVHDELVGVAHMDIADEVAALVRATMIEAGEYFLRDTPERKAVRMDAECKVAHNWAK